MFTLIAKWVLNFLGGNVLEKVSQMWQAKLNSDNEVEKQKAQVITKLIDGEIAERNAQKDIIIAEQGWKVTAFIRPAFAYPLAIYYALIIADSIFHFTWDVSALPEPMMTWSGYIVVAYFGGRTIEKTAKSIGYWFGNRGTQPE